MIGGGFGAVTVALAASAGAVRADLAVTGNDLGSTAAAIRISRS
jgi:hypothetical protein